LTGSAAGLLVLLGVAAAALPDAPALGSSPDGLDSSTFQCSSHERVLRCERPGREGENVAGIAVIAVVLFYRDGSLVRSVHVFDEQGYDEVVHGLSKQLGVPEPHTESLKAGMGGVFENRQRIWRRDGTVWMFEQYFERILHSGLWRMHESEYEKLLTARERVTVRGARDL
jgi:hypothetical protein